MPAWGNLVKGRKIYVTDLYGSGRSDGAHDGVDIDVREGQPFYCMYAGIVLASGRVPGYSDYGTGDMIVIQISLDGKKYDVIYQEFGGGTEKVKKGDHVKRGQEIGLGGTSSGSTSSGLHVHVGMVISSLGYLHINNSNWNKTENILKYLDIDNSVGWHTLSSKFGAGGDESEQTDGGGSSNVTTTTVTNITNNIFFKDLF